MKYYLLSALLIAGCSTEVKNYDENPGWKYNDAIPLPEIKSDKDDDLSAKPLVNPKKHKKRKHDQTTFGP